MVAPIILSRVPGPDIGETIPAVVLGFFGVNVTRRRIKTGRIQMTNEFYNSEAETRTVGFRATTKTYQGWWSAQELHEQDYLGTLRDWASDGFRVRCNDDRTGSEWEILDFDEDEPAPYGINQDFVNFTIMLVKRKSPQ